jgi:DNA-binding transcriptional MocR family regulator
LRVGFIAASPEIAQHLSDRKILSALTTSEISERVVYKVLSEGYYRKHLDRLRTRLNQVRDKAVRQLERVGLKLDIGAPAGMFVWVDTGCNTNVLAEKAMEHGYLLAPGSLFSPNQLPSTRMRINVTTMSDSGVLRFLEKNVG